jgi:lysophospholipase L1-like esterase
MNRSISGAAILAFTALALLPPAPASAGNRIECGDAGKLVALSRTLPRLSQRLARGEPVTIVAIGSSSTQGYGASDGEHTYPRRLEIELRERFTGARLRVLNHGVGGEDAQQMLGRIDRALAEEKPDLVLWQVGTNALLRENGVAAQAGLIHDGLRRIRHHGADVVLIDPQYAPKVLRDPDAKPMVALLASIAEETGVPVFRRFALMQHWHETREIAFAEILSPDLFHMNDWSYGCLAANLATALTNAVVRPAPTTETARGPAQAVGDFPVTRASAPR